MLARPRARNASAASPRVSLNLTPRPKPLPSPTPEPESAPEVEPKSPRKSEVDAANAALRSVLFEMHERAEATRECSQVLDDVIDRVIADEERRVVEEARADAERSFEIIKLMHDLIGATETRAADLVAEQCAVASQLAAEMADACVCEAAADVARDVFVTVQDPTVVRWNVGAQDVARACGLNVHAPVFIPTNSPFSSLPYYI